MDKRNDIHGGHRERLRQRLISEGVDNFEPHELLEFLLYYAIPRQNVNMLAHELLNYFGTFRNVLGADVQELIRVKGMGEHAAVWLNQIGRCIDICGQIEPNGALKTPTSSLIIQSLREMNSQPKAPCLMQVCMNQRNHLLYRRILCSSREWGEPEVLREGIRDVFSTGASGVVLVLYSNDGSLIPTQYDLQKIQEYAYALKTADSELLDFILLQDGKWHSLRRDGHIPDLQSDNKTQRMREEYIADFPDETGRDNDLNCTQGGKT